MGNATLVIARREFLEKMRAPYVIALSLVYALLIVVNNTIVYQWFLDDLRNINIFSVTIIGYPQPQPNLQLLTGMNLFLALGPLFVIAIAFGTVVYEKSTRSLNLLLSHPVSRSNIVIGKVLGLTLVFLPVVATLPVLGVAVSLASVGGLTLQMAIRLVCLELLAVLYLFFWLALTMLISVVAPSPGDSLAIAGAVWLVLLQTVFQPLADAFVAGLVFPGQSALQIASSPLYLSLNSLVTSLLPPYGVADAIFGQKTALGFSTGVIPTSYILNPSITLLSWLSYAFGDFLVLCVSSVVLLLASHFLFSKMDLG